VVASISEWENQLVPRKILMVLVPLVVFSGLSMAYGEVEKK
jgi:thiosulfate reductase cytochrome b subunit